MTSPLARFPDCSDSDRPHKMAAACYGDLPSKASRHLGRRCASHQDNPEAVAFIYWPVRAGSVPRREPACIAGARAVTTGSEEPQVSAAPQPRPRAEEQVAQSSSLPTRLPRARRALAHEAVVTEDGPHPKAVAGERFAQRRPGGVQLMAAALILPSRSASAKARSASARSERDRAGLPAQRKSTSRTAMGDHCASSTAFTPQGRGPRTAQSAQMALAAVAWGGLAGVGEEQLRVDLGACSIIPPAGCVPS
jgi:hypothetical protein